MSDHTASRQGNDAQAKDRRKPRKPRPKPDRRIKILEQPSPDTDGWGAVQITAGKETAVYLVHFVPSDFGFGACGFEVEKLDADLVTVESYQVHLSDRPEDRSCTCKGHLRHGHCKHCDGLAALRKAGKLPTFRSGGDMKRNAPEQLERHLLSISDEPPELPPWADFDPRDEDVEPDPAA